MNERASLRHFLESWRGKSYSAEQAEAGVPVHKLTWQPCLLTVEHKTSGKGRTYAFPHPPTPLPKVMKDAIPDVHAYKRAPYWEDRKAAYAAEVAAVRGPALENDMETYAAEADDEVPF